MRSWHVACRGATVENQAVSGSVNPKVKRTVLLRPGRGSGQPGPCEHCGRNVATDAHHRVLKGQGGPDVASNLAAVCRLCHDWLHENRIKAQLRGFILPSTADFRRRGMLLYDGLLVTLDDDGDYAFQGEAA